ncbi:MAG: hypothetical protein LRS43_04365, partial [Desulfurococcales archaeon]|nr:hypothetical protein [Desulfurococcales archaeon]
LIVSDTLVAKREGRQTSEGAGPAYVRSWERELDPVLELLDAMVKSPRARERVLESYLGSIRSILS